MNKLLKKFETAMMAIAFAESGDADTARRIMEEDRLDTEGQALSYEEVH